MNQEVYMVRLILALYEDLKASCSAGAVGNWLVQIVHHIAVEHGERCHWRNADEVCQQWKKLRLLGKMNQIVDMQWFRLQLQTLEREDFSIRGCEIYKWITWKVFALMIQQSLNENRAPQNSTTVRKQVGLELLSGHLQILSRWIHRSSLQLSTWQSHHLSLRRVRSSMLKQSSSHWMMDCWWDKRKLTGYINT